MGQTSTANIHTSLQFLLDLLTLEMEVTVRSMKAYCVSGGAAPLVHNFSTKWMWSLIFTSWQFCSLETPPPLYPFNGWTDGPQSRWRLSREERNFLPLSANEPRTVSHVVLTLYQRSYPSSQNVCSLHVKSPLLASNFIRVCKVLANFIWSPQN